MIRLALIGWPDDLASIVQAAMRLHGGRFTAVVDSNIRKAEKLAQSLEATIWCETHEKLKLDYNQEFDAIVWPYTAFQKPVVAAKPLLTSMTEAARITKVSASQPPCVMAAHASRFLPAVRVVKESLDAGKLGVPGLLRTHTWDARVPMGVRGTYLLEHLTNEIDLACWFFGQRPEIIYASAPEAKQDYVQVHLGFAGGGMALLGYGRTLAPGEAYSSLSLIGSTGAAYADEHHNMQLCFGGGQKTALPTRPKDGYLLSMLQEFVASIAEDRAPSVTGADSLLALEVAEAAGASLVIPALRWDGERYTLVE